MLATDTPFRQFYDLQGRPLAGGRLYFGEAGQNPLTHPITVYWDTDGTQPAAQPVRTSMGFPMRSGTPAVIYVGADYSILVQDNQGRQVFFARNSQDFSLSAQFIQLKSDLSASGPSNGAALVGYDGGSLQDIADSFKPLANYTALRNYTGRASVVRITQSGIAGFFTRDDADTTSGDNGATIIVDAAGRRWRREFTGYCDVKWFGAKGDYNGSSGTDDTAAIQAAINWVQSNTNTVASGSYSPSAGTGVLFFPQGSYKVTAPLIFTVKLCILGEGQTEYSYGSRITQVTQNTDIFQAAPSAGSTSFSIENMILRSNAGAGTGHLVNTVRTGGGYINSQRYVNCTFAQPQSMALYLAGDDIAIQNCLFDVSTQSGDVIQLGTPSYLATNVRINGSNFFYCTNSCVKLVNVDGFTWSGNTVTQPNGTTKTLRVFDAISTTPTLATNINICGGTIKGPRTLFGGANVTNVVINGLTVSGGGIGTGEINNMITLTGNCSVNIVGNYFRGSYWTANFYNDSGAGTVFGNIDGNLFVNDGGAGDALNCSKLVGRIGSNNYAGFTNRQMGEKRATSGSPVAPGTIAAGATFAYSLTVSSATFGDTVNVGTISNAWVAQTGIDVRAFVNAANTVRVEYRNTTAGSLTVAAHDISVEVTR